MSTCVHVVKAPITPGQVEILITPEGLVILISCGHWSLEAVIVTTIRVQTRDRIIIIIVVVCREKERFYTMTVTVRQGVGALNARADDLVSRALILDLERVGIIAITDNVFPGAAPEDQDDGAGAEADGALHTGHQSQALQARALCTCSVSSKYLFTLLIVLNSKNRVIPKSPTYTL